MNANKNPFKMATITTAPGAISSLGGMVGRTNTLNTKRKPTKPRANPMILTMFFFMAVVVLWLMNKGKTIYFVFKSTFVYLFSI